MQVPTESTFEQTARRLRILLFVVAGGALVYALSGIVQLIVAGGLLAYVLNPLVSRLEARTSRNWATGLVFVCLLLAFGLGVYLLLGVGWRQLQVIAEQAQGSPLANDLRQYLEGLPIVGQRSFDVADRLQSMLEGGSLFSDIQNLVSFATKVVIVPFVAVFLLRDGPQIKRQLIRWVPNRYFEFSLDAVHKVDQQLGNYFRGLILDMLAVMLLSTAALWILGVGPFILLGLLCGLANVIPYVGVAAGGVISTVVTFLNTGGDETTTAMVALAFIGIAALDEGVIQPYLMSQTVELHPLEVLLSVAVAAQFFGVAGMVLAIPVASAGKVVVTEGFALIQRYRFD